MASNWTAGCNCILQEHSLPSTSQTFHTCLCSLQSCACWPPWSAHYTWNLIYKINKLPAQCSESDHQVAATPAKLEQETGKVPKWEHNSLLQQQHCVRLIHLSIRAPLWEERYLTRSYTLNSWLYELYTYNAIMCENIFHLYKSFKAHELVWFFFFSTETASSFGVLSTGKTRTSWSKVTKTTGGMGTPLLWRKAES